MTDWTAQSVFFVSEYCQTTITKSSWKSAARVTPESDFKMTP